MRPVTREQWQDAVDAAEVLSCITTAQVLLIIEMGRLFGLVNDNDEVDLQACMDILDDGRRKGLSPRLSMLRSKK